MSTRKGRIGEQVAARYLERKGYSILVKNFRMRGGEIDLIAMSPKKEIVVVEVKRYSENAMVSPLEAISVGKQKRIRKTAELFLLKHRLNNVSVRFDVILVTDGLVSDHLKNAF